MKPPAKSEAAEQLVIERTGSRVVVTTAEARTAFETWGRSRGMYVLRREGEYPDSAVRFAWDAWLAGWRQARHGR